MTSASLVTNPIVKQARGLLRKLGVDVVRHKERPPFPPDFDVRAQEIIRAVQPFTMTNPGRLFALIEAVRYIVKSGIPGSFAECGVWRGGSMMAVAHALLDCGERGRELCLFDTFAGMTRPAAEDVNYLGEPAADEFARRGGANGASNWCYASLDEVRANLATTGYPADRIKFIQGRVEETIPDAAPAQIALLRLDTDWYESTRHELTHLFPRLAPRAVLIVDDYGFWQGCRRAVDEYFAENGIDVLLNRIDETARIAVVP